MATDTTRGVPVEVTIPTLLRDSVGGRASVRVAGATLADALGDLRATYPLLKVLIFDELGALRKHVLIFYNGDSIAWLEHLDVPLRPGDRIDVLQAVSGG
jgi:molybdopterin converting factor small subunit